MQGSKIRLSIAEMELFTNADIILTKNSIVQKTILLLEEVQESLLNEETLVNHIESSSPKISKGENYLGLPYTILDYPRISGNGNLFFIRSMFWWGNFYSSTLQLAGDYKDRYLQNLETAHDVLSKNNYSIGINEDPWVHHFNENNYKKISELTEEEFSITLEKSHHIKIAANWPLNEWDSAANKLIESWKLLAGLIT